MTDNIEKISRAAAERVAEVLKAVAHPIRIEIVEALEEGELCVGDIAALLGIKQAIISQQLNLMKDKGVLACRREGVNVYYRVENRNVIRLLECVRDHCETDISERAGPG